MLASFFELLPQAEQQGAHLLNPHPHPSPSPHPHPKQVVSCLSISADKSDDWCNYACRVNNKHCPPHAQKLCKCGEDATSEVRLLARVAAAARARKQEQASEQAGAH